MPQWLVLHLDHVFCMVPPAGDWPSRLAEAGWRVDEGSRHPGQGTRNRRLVCAQAYVELVWVEDLAEARTNPLRLDRRADWASSGASPFGVGLRGRPTEEQLPDFWLYEALGFPVWVHRDNEERPQRPLVFVLDPPRRAHAPHPGSTAALRALRHRGPAPARLPAYGGPPFEFRPGPHGLEVVVGTGRPVAVTGLLSVVVDRGPPAGS